MNYITRTELTHLYELLLKDGTEQSMSIADRIENAMFKADEQDGILLMPISKYDQSNAYVLDEEDVGLIIDALSYSSEQVYSSNGDVEPFSTLSYTAEEQLALADKARELAEHLGK